MKQIETEITAHTVTVSFKDTYLTCSGDKPSIVIRSFLSSFIRSAFATIHFYVLPKRQTVVIDDALASEASEVQIEVELLCGCDCKNVESSRCEHGVNECGICKCDFGWSGKSA